MYTLETSGELSKLPPKELLILNEDLIVTIWANGIFDNDDPDIIYESVD